MKKRTLLFSFIGILFLAGCSNSKSMANYVDVSFEGMNTKGRAIYSVDYQELYEDTLNYNAELAIPDEKTRKEIDSMEGSYKIKLDKQESLKNGDKVKVIVTVDESKTKKIKSGEKTIEVKGLEEPKKLTNEEVEKHLVINFNGVSGRGQSQIDNTFDSPLNNIDFTIENDGKLKNNDHAKITLSKAEEEILINNGYVVEKDFAPTFEVKGLDVVADNAIEINNIDDIKRMIDEGVNREYKSSESNQYQWDTRYEITEEKIMYRPFKKETKNEQNSYWGSSGSDNGNLVKIYTVKSFSGGAESKLKDTKTVIFGFTDIILDETGNANVAELEEIKEVKDDTYSLESVIKLYEGYGYTEVK